MVAILPRAGSLPVDGCEVFHLIDFPSLLVSSHVSCNCISEVMSNRLMKGNHPIYFVNICCALGAVSKVRHADMFVTNNLFTCQQLVRSYI